jgi:hypothetical protein
LANRTNDRCLGLMTVLMESLSAAVEPYILQPWDSVLSCGVVTHDRFGDRIMVEFRYSVDTLKRYGEDLE